VTGNSLHGPLAASKLHFPTVYESYAYSYPHKSAYAMLARPRRLRDVWANERRDHLSLYIHVPFCGMRCGFCNLFTMANPKPRLTARYLEAFERQAETLAEELDGARAAHFVIGGGTPTYLAAENLARLMDTAIRLFNADMTRIPSSVETSPGTASEERLAVLAERHVERVSIGAQSFSEVERCAMGRPQKRTQLESALDCIRQAGFPVLNIDLIYGAENQTVETLRQSLRRALMWHPEELYLYPLYVRPETGLGGRVETWDAHRVTLYRAARDFLLSEGYVQMSMRLFQRADRPQRADAAEFSCHNDGMLGLGPGARSTTKHLHYSTKYAVDRSSVMRILDVYCEESADAHHYATYGIELDDDDQIRRYVLKSILRSEGLDMARFTARFGFGSVWEFAPLARLADARLLEEAHGFLRPTAAGLELSDAIGPWLYAPRIQASFRAEHAR
jgi:oxygen-independent coproporphyrinogen III oxidase